MSSCCPRFETCSATKCPLDDQVHARRHLPGDRVCPYLLAHAKDEKPSDLSDDDWLRVCRYGHYLFSPTGMNEIGLHDIRNRWERSCLQPRKRFPWGEP